MATGATWVPPLPAGYEARWDPNQRAYFFINHSTKTTTWQDPRWPQQPQQPQAHQSHQTHHTAAAHSLNKGFTAAGQGQNVPMTTMYKQFGGTTTRADASDDEDWEGDWESDTELPFSETTGDQKKVDIAKLHQLKQIFPSAPEESIKSALRTNNNVLGMATMTLSAAGFKKEESTAHHPPPRVVDMQERLRAMFPTANAGLISDILEQAHHNETAARAQLEAIGYKAQYTPTHKTTIDHSPKKTVSPAREVSPKRTSPSKTSLSEGQKARILSKLKGEYKDTDESVITMALQVCDYDETRVKNLLERMHGETEAPRPSSSSSRPGTSTSRERSISPVPVISSGSLEPVAFDIDLSSLDKSKRPGTSSSSSRTTPDRKSPSKSSRTPTPKSSATSHTSHTRQQRTKNVTELSEDVLTSTVDVLNHLANNVSCCQRQDDQSNQEEDLLANQNQADSSHSRRAVVSRQPVASGSAHVSQYRTPAKGPDPSLRVGPNTDLLLKEYVLAKGPNPDIRQGPDPSRAMGPQGAVGPDKSLWCGPQRGLLQGTSSGTALVSAV